MEMGIPSLPNFKINSVGSVPTPYIWDDRCEPEDAAERIDEVYMMGRGKKRQTRRRRKTVGIRR
jgi:hypothetical protein